MRSLRLAGRLAARNLRRRPGQALLLLLTLTVATGVLGLAIYMVFSALERRALRWHPSQRIGAT